MNTKPAIINKLEEELTLLISKDDTPYLAIKEVAKFMGLDTETLRKLIINGHCPFAVGYPSSASENSYSKILKLPFYNYMTL